MKMFTLYSIFNNQDSTQHGKLEGYASRNLKIKIIYAMI